MRISVLVSSSLEPSLYDLFSNLDELFFPFVSCLMKLMWVDWLAE